jgi:hypothetical protein
MRRLGIALRGMHSHLGDDPCMPFENSSTRSRADGMTIETWPTLEATRQSLLASGDQLQIMLQKTRQAYRKCHPNEVLKSQMLVKGIAEGEGLVIRRCTDECINAPTIQVSDEFATLSASRTTTESMRSMSTHISRRSASGSSC